MVDPELSLKEKLSALPPEVVGREVEVILAHAFPPASTEPWQTDASAPENIHYREQLQLHLGRIAAHNYLPPQTVAGIIKNLEGWSYGWGKIGEAKVEVLRKQMPNSNFNRYNSRFRFLDTFVLANDSSISLIVESVTPQTIMHVLNIESFFDRIRGEIKHKEEFARVKYSKEAQAFSQALGIQRPQLNSTETGILSASAFFIDNESVATYLGLAPTTIADYFQRLKRKFNIASKEELAILAIKWRLAGLENTLSLNIGEILSEEQRNFISNYYSPYAEERLQAQTLPPETKYQKRQEILRLLKPYNIETWHEVLLLALKNRAISWYRPIT